MSIQVSRRRGLARLGALAAGLLAIVVVFAVSASGSSEVPPADGAAAVVPGDALAYVHLSTDPSRPAVKRALSLAAHLPDYPPLAAAVTNRLGAIAANGGQVQFARDIRPWLGKEAAFALLNTATATAGSLIVLDVRNAALAHEFVRRSGATAAGPDRGVELYGYPAGTALAFLRHYLVLGQEASVRAAVDVAAGAAQSLAANPDYRRAAAGVLLYNPALSGATILVSAAPQGARVYEHSALDPALVHLRDRRTAEFSPSLTSELPAGATLLLDVNGLAQAAPRILAAGSVAGFAGAVAPLLSRLGRALAAEGVDVHGALSLFSGETAVAVTPGSSASGGSPALVIVTRTRDESRARSLLAALELPLAQLFPAPASGPGVAPEFYDRTVAGITAHQLSLTPGLNLDYAVFDGLVVVSTSLDGIAGVALHEHALPADPAYRLALAGSPAHVSSLLFLDFSQLLSLGEQTGLISGTRYRLLRPDLEKVRAVGLVSTGGESDSTAELTLQIK